MPLMKITGNFTSAESIMTSAGVSVGSAAISTPTAEKQKLARTSPDTKTSGWTIVRSRSKIAIERGTVVIAIPMAADAIKSPKSIHESPIGEETNRSRVFVLVSQGVITGLIEVEVNQIAILNRPVPSISGGISLPSQKARKKKKGRSIPNITTGPFT